MDSNFTISQEINGPVLATLIGIEMMTGLIANSFVLALTACHSTTWKQPSTIFLTNMLLTNLVMTVSVMPFIIITSASGEWILGETIEQKIIACQFVGFMFWVSITLVTVSLVVISFDRFFFVVKALQYRQYMKPSIATIIVIASWIFSIVINIPMIPLRYLIFSSSFATCTPSFHSIGFTVYMVVFFILALLSFTITSIWTFCFTQKFLQNTQTRRNYSGLVQDNVYTSKSRMLMGIFGMLILVHLLCYLPGIVNIVIGIFIRSPLKYYTTSTCVIFLLEPTLNPLIQSYFRRDVRQTIGKFIHYFQKVHTCSPPPLEITP